MKPLLAYRAQSREYFTKTSSEKLIDHFHTIDKGRELPEQLAIQEYILGQSMGVTAGVRDVIIYKEKFDRVMESKNYDELCSLIIQFRKRPSVLCSTAIYPESDFHGNKLQDISDLDLTPETIACTSVAHSDGGSVVFSWFRKNNKGICEKFINSLKKVNTDKLTSILILFFFEYSENIYMEPDWWESLDSIKQEKLNMRILSGITPIVERNDNSLCNDNTQYDDWGFLEFKEI